MNKNKRFLPTTCQEMSDHGWDQCNVILVSGDAYIDSPFIGVSVVRMIEQPNVESDQDISRLGEPRLFWGAHGLT